MTTEQMKRLSKRFDGRVVSVDVTYDPGEGDDSAFSGRVVIGGRIEETAEGSTEKKVMRQLVERCGL